MFLYFKVFNALIYVLLRVIAVRYTFIGALFYSMHKAEVSLLYPNMGKSLRSTEGVKVLKHHHRHHRRDEGSFVCPTSTQ